ncbi:MAG: FAD-dependent oxidoreductase [Desulfovibrio sp.]|jgi:thioredoxin reductase (NADPH)|nr:FAD-dependent oxidoreductase [Desulfovibrio sp.]
MPCYDALVLGAGPAGITAALYLARCGISVGLVEQLAPGGLVLLTHTIENYPGFPKGISGYELADAFTAQLAPYKNLIHIHDEVSEADLLASPKRLRVGQQWLEAEAVILAMGGTYRSLGLPDEQKFLGRGVSHCALCDGNFFRNQIVGVVGGGDSALEETLYLGNIVSRIHLIHRRDAFRAASVYQDKVRAMPNVALELSTVVERLHGKDILEGVTLKRLRTGEEEYLPLSGLFIFAGFLPRTQILPPDIGLNAEGFIFTDMEMRTAIPGVFAAGDIRAKLCRQVVTAVGDGAVAANAAFTYLEQRHG